MDDMSQESVLLNPATGEVIDARDTDGLIDALERTRMCKAELAANERGIVLALLQRTEEEGIGEKTRRVRGARRRAKLTMPDMGWDQAALRSAWHTYPKFRDELLRVERIGVNVREYRKALKEAGPSDFQECIKTIISAERQPVGLPSVAIEKDTANVVQEGNEETHLRPRGH